MKLKLKGVDSQRTKMTMRVAQRGVLWLRNSNVRTFLLCVLLSVCSWMLQQMQSSIVRKVNVPVGYDKQEVKWSFSDTIPSYIALEVEAKGYDHMRYSLYGMDTIKLKLIQEASASYIGIDAQELNRELREILGRESSVRILQQIPTSIRIPLHQQDSRVLAVRLGASPRLAPGNTTRSIRFMPDSIVVYGETSLLSTLASVELSPLPETPLEENLTTLLTPQLPQGVYSSVSKVEVRIEVEELTELNFTLPVQAKNVPEGYQLTSLPSTVAVRVTLPRSRYNDIKPEDLEISVDYSDVVEQGVQERQGLELRLTRRPSWLSGYSIQPTRVQYILQADSPSSTSRDE